MRLLYLATRVLSLSGLAHTARRVIVRNGRFALVLHDIIGSRRSYLAPASQYGLTVAESDAILRWLTHRFRLLTPQEFLTTDQPGILLTFDDGKANNFTNLLPLLERYHAPAVLFVSTQHVLNSRDWLPHTRQCAQTQWPKLEDVPDEYAWEYFNGMTPEQVAHCGQHPLITLGAHTVSHALLPECDDDALAYELAESKRQLETLSGQTVNTFAYPAGDYDFRVAEAVQKVGYDFAFAVTPKKVGMIRYEIPRVYVENGDIHALDVKLSGLYSHITRGILQDF